MENRLTQARLAELGFPGDYATIKSRENAERALEEGHGRVAAARLAASAEITERREYKDRYKSELDSVTTAWNRDLHRRLAPSLARREDAAPKPTDEPDPMVAHRRQQEDLWEQTKTFVSG